MESASGRSTAAPTALLPRSRHPTTEDGGCAHGPARRGAPRRGEAAVASNSSQTSAKVSVYPSALYYYWEQRRIAKGRKKARALLELCRDVDYFYEAFYGLFRSLFKYIHYIFPPTLTLAVWTQKKFFPLLTRPQGSQGCQKIRFFFLQMKMFSFCAKIAPKRHKLQKTIKIEEKMSNKPCFLGLF